MKKYFLILAVFLLSSISYSQEASNHLKFKGIPIDGSLSEFTSKMKAKGFEYIGTEDGMAVFSGEFAGYKQCYIIAKSLKSTNKVSQVAVAFGDYDTWSRLHNSYATLKSMLTQKYGSPTEEIEKFESTFEPTDDNDKLHEVQFNRCKYISLWENENGDIELSIDHLKSDCIVQLIYIDKANHNDVYNSAIDDL